MLLLLWDGSYFHGTEGATVDSSGTSFKQRQTEAIDVVACRVIGSIVAEETAQIARPARSPNSKNFISALRCELLPLESVVG
jgi:hypothetical protein